MERSTKNKKKLTIIISILTIILIVGGIIIFNTSLGYKLKVSYLLSYKKNHTAEETHQLLDRMFDINSKNNDEVYNIVFADEIQATKKALAEFKEKEDESKINSISNITIEDARQIPNSNEIEFKINNQTHKNIGYIELLVNFYDGNNNIISNEWTNELNIPVDTRRLKQTYVTFPDGTKGFNVTVSKVNFEN